MPSKVREVTSEEAARIEKEEREKKALEELEDIDDSEDDEESLLDRIVAIKEFVPESARTRMTNAASWMHQSSTTGLKWMGKAGWIFTTSMLLLALPVLLAVESEQAIEQMEKEQREALQQQRQ
eukprot:Ihof_evm1s962 gene=Ihof_evmTU1s962